MTKEQHLKFVEAWWDKKLEYKTADGIWTLWDSKIPPTPSYSSYEANLRIKPELKYRAWLPEEVPVGVVVRNHDRDKTEIYRWTISAVSPLGVTFGHPAQDQISFEILLSRFSYSLDFGKTWQPCGVEVKE